MSRRRQDTSARPQKASAKASAKRPRRQSDEKPSPPAPNETEAVSTSGVPRPTGDGGLFPAGRYLETGRTHWQYGAWEELTDLRAEKVAADPDRAKLSILIAAAHGCLGDHDAARLHARKALEWGCDRGIVARVLVSAVRNSLGTAAVALDEAQEATAHFHEAIRLVEPRADVRLLARTREIRQTARLGLLPDALTALDNDLRELANRPEEVGAQLGMLRTEVDLLKHELALSLKRGQLYRSDHAYAAATGIEALTAHAVSQLGQELWVLEKTGQRRGGYFVEFGATDGITLSNTWLLETEFGWQGLCAEPNPVLFGQLRANRKCQVVDACIGARTGDEVEFILADAYGCIADYADADMHGEKRAAFKAAGQVSTMTTVSLEDLLLQQGAPREIDYLSIDTEGSEYDILAAFPFDRWKIRLLTVEHNFTKNRESIRALLEGHGYVRTEVNFDDWYELIEDS